MGKENIRKEQDETVLQVDLHVHSNESDGTLTPKELVLLAGEKGLAAFALTDHNTTAGIDIAISFAKEQYTETGDAAEISVQSAGTRVEVVPGIELSSLYNGRDIHILGYYMDYHNDDFQKKLAEFRSSRKERNREMFRRLREKGFSGVTEEALKEEFGDVVITRAHMAAFMLSSGYVKSREEAFERYIGNNCPCYIASPKITSAEAVSFITEFGGIAVLAHPLLYNFGEDMLCRLAEELKEAGLKGIEVIYSGYSGHEQKKLYRLAEKYGLIVTGGSDFHGSNKKDIELGCGTGKLFVPYKCLTDIKGKLK